jgi:hypothetical protein
MDKPPKVIKTEPSIEQFTPQQRYRLELTFSRIYRIKQRMKTEGRI